MCNDITEEERARIVSELKTFSLAPRSLEKLIAISEFVVHSDAKGYLHEIYASDVTYKEPRILEDIKNDVLYSGLTSDSESLVLSLIDEAYELGRKAAENGRD